MIRPEDTLADLVGEARDLAIGQLLEKMGRALEGGARVRHEPFQRTREGRVLREGPLHLPRRADLAVTEGTETRILRLPAAPQPMFKPCSVPRPDHFLLKVRPFSWNRARMFLRGDAGGIDWKPLRHWFLEAFQSRYDDVAPDLDGAVHALLGPREVEDGWEITVDLGSAPLSSFLELIDTLVIARARRLTISASSRWLEGGGR